MEKVTIIGGGNGAFAAASDLTSRGNQVTLYEVPEFSASIKEVVAKGGIDLECLPSNGLRGGFAEIYKITTDIAEAMAESQIVMIIVPTYSIDTIIKLCAPHLRDGQIVCLCPANFGGSLYFHKCLKDMGIDKKIWIAEFACMMYACRKTGPSSVWIRGYKHDLGVAIFPRKNSEPIFDRLQGLYPYIAKYNSMIETGLSNMNTTMHTSIMLMSSACIDNGGENRLFYRECVTPALDNILDKLNEERMNLTKLPGVKLPTLPQILQHWYTYQGAEGEKVSDLLHSLPIFARSPLPTTLDHRYITEDVPFGLIPIAEFMDQYGFDHTFHTSLANILCAICGRDFYKSARTMDQLGIRGMSIERLMDYLDNGI